MLKVSAGAIGPVVVLLIIILSSIMAALPPKRKWVPFTANLTGLGIYNLSVVDVKEELLCSILASTDQLSNLYCFGPQGCAFGYVYLPDAEGVQTPGYNCSYSHICVHGGKYYYENETAPDPVCPKLILTCTKRGMINLAIDVPPLRSCVPPFVPHSFGCLFFNLTQQTLCQAKASCLARGAQVASPISHDNFVALMDYLLSTYGTSYKNDFWAGVSYIDSTWRYESNGRFPGPDRTGEWAADEPDYGGQICVRFRFFTGVYALADIFCDENYAVICHAWNLEI